MKLAPSLLMLLGVVLTFVVLGIQRRETPSRTRTRELVLESIAAEYPGFRAGEIELAIDGAAALVFAEDLRKVLFFLRIGDRWSSRALDASRIGTLCLHHRTDGNGELVVDLPDPSFPHFRMRATAVDAERLRAALERQHAGGASGTGRSEHASA